jgi:hypothetical protein
VLSAERRNEIVKALDLPDDYDRLKPYISWLEYKLGRLNTIGGPDAAGEIFRDIVLHFKVDVNSTITNFINLPNNRNKLSSIVRYFNDSTHVKYVCRHLRMWMMLDSDGNETPKAWENIPIFSSGEFTVADFIAAHQLDIFAKSGQDPPPNDIPRSLLKAKNIREIGGITFVWTFDITKHLHFDKETAKLHLFRLPCKGEFLSTFPSEKALK